MKIGLLLVAGLMMSAPAFAQQERAYLEGVGGFSVSSFSGASTNLTSGNGALQGGFKLTKGLHAFGEFGRIGNLQSDTVASVDDALTSLSTIDGLDVTGTTKTPATYGLGGVRFEIPTHSRITPYALGGIGVARLAPSTHFSFADGTLPNADPSAPLPIPGDDVTAQVESAGVFIEPPASSSFMYSLGAGVQLNLARRWVVDGGYRYSHIDADTAVHAQGMNFGLGYRF